MVHFAIKTSCCRDRAGFGGLSVVRELEEPGVSITIIDRSNHHLFQPLLYQVAGVSLPSAEIASARSLSVSSS